MMSARWELKPLTGVGPLFFGMSRADVTSLEETLGPIYAEFTQTGPEGQPIVQEARDMGAPVLFFRDNRLSGIQLDRYTKFDIIFDGTSIFSDSPQDVLIAFEKANGGAFSGLDAILFNNLSISTNGFFIGRRGDGSFRFWEDAADAPPKVLNMETEHSYQPYLQNYEPISFLR